MNDHHPETEKPASAEDNGSVAKFGFYPRSATELARLEAEGHDLSSVRRTRESHSSRKTGK